jgi:hypothetical protein
MTDRLIGRGHGGDPWGSFIGTALVDNAIASAAQ